jgi:hypothetical protein
VPHIRVRLRRRSDVGQGINPAQRAGVRVSHTQQRQRVAALLLEAGSQHGNCQGASGAERPLEALRTTVRCGLCTPQGNEHWNMLEVFLYRARPHAQHSTKRVAFPMTSPALRATEQSACAPIADDAAQMHC